MKLTISTLLTAAYLNATVKAAYDKASCYEETVIAMTIDLGSQNPYFCEETDLTKYLDRSNIDCVNDPYDKYIGEFTIKANWGKLGCISCLNTCATTHDWNWSAETCDDAALTKTEAMYPCIDEKCKTDVDYIPSFGVVSMYYSDYDKCNKSVPMPACMESCSSSDPSTCDDVKNVAKCTITGCKGRDLVVTQLFTNHWSGLIDNNEGDVAAPCFVSVQEIYTDTADSVQEINTATSAGAVVSSVHPTMLVAAVIGVVALDGMLVGF